MKTAMQEAIELVKKYDNREIPFNVMLFNLDPAGVEPQPNSCQRLPKVCTTGEPLLTSGSFRKKRQKFGKKLVGENLLTTSNDHHCKVKFNHGFI